MKQNHYLFLLIAIVFSLSFYVSAQPQRKDNPCYPKTGCALDLGAGVTIIGNAMNQDFYHSFAAGIRIMHHFKTRFGIDFVKMNLSSPFNELDYPKLMNLQFLTGVRLYSRNFYKCMNVYGALRLGYGFHFVNTSSHGLVVETEVGINLNRTFYLALSYNLLSSFNKEKKQGYGNYYYYEDVIVATTYNTCALRIGFNFGK